MAEPQAPGLLILHGNRLELLQEAVLAWLGQHPLPPLAPEVFLVQSNGIAEWLKMAVAEHTGVCAATQVELPARFLWRSYGQMLGRHAVPHTSPLEKSQLTWRLMRLLPQCLDEAVYAPLRHFLADPEPSRRWQLAQRLADLFDQYQVYRADWLQDWQQGRDQVRDAQGQARPLPPDQLWQAALWRTVQADLGPERAALGRADIHQRFLAAVAAGQRPQQALPQRVVVFGVSALPQQSIEALAALAQFVPVLVAILNPCQYHWADIISGRELLASARRRQQHKQGRDLAQVALADLHAFGHPLLASWGRQGRDFIRMLDVFDDTPALGQRWAMPRIDLFDDSPPAHMLATLQAQIRDLEPLPEQMLPVADTDRSLVFHVAHSLQREVEILHDQLLAGLAQGAWQPRDVLVMVPDIDQVAPAIHAVFGQYEKNDPRYIPYDVADQRLRGLNPVLQALEWLLQLPQQRCGASEVLALLSVPAVARRFDLKTEDLPTLERWLDGAGIRWGLSAAHRNNLGLDACGEQNSWWFGVQRMLLGYAAGDLNPHQSNPQPTHPHEPPPCWHDIEPYAEIGGLEASLAGGLIACAMQLLHWQTRLQALAGPAQWGELARELLPSFFMATDEREELTLLALDQALSGWLHACADAEYQEAVPVQVLREAWLQAVDEPHLHQRFLSGGVTFCTLMPMRAIPFAVICLLGMNDGDYPRPTQRADFDLLVRPELYRPGDRSRRDDDRYLMLEALLSARQQLYISWSGRNVRDNSEQPPSVLVAQMRDCVRLTWGAAALQARTVEHPLQPFSRRYFENNSPLWTYAHEWRSAHNPPSEPSAEASMPTATDWPHQAWQQLPPWQAPPEWRLNLKELAQFLRNPVKYFLRHRLHVVFSPWASAEPDHEPFDLDGLAHYTMVEELLAPLRQAAPPARGHATQLLAHNLQRIRRAGRLPMAELGAQQQRELQQSLHAMAQAWAQLQQQWPLAAEQVALRCELAQHPLLEDWLDGLSAQAEGQRAWLVLDPNRLLEGENLRLDKLLNYWLRQLLASACGLAVPGWVVGRDAQLELPVLDQATAEQALVALLQAWHAGMQQPLPVACKTGLTLLQAQTTRETDPSQPDRVNPDRTSKAQACYEGGYHHEGEVNDPALARVYPNFEALWAQGQLLEWAQRLFGPMLDWAEGINIQLHASAHDRQFESTGAPAHDRA